MRIHLAPHVLVEKVGDKVVLLDTSTTLVHTLPSTQVVSVDTETRVLTLHKDASHEQHALEPFTEKAENVSGITRRAAVGLGGVAVTSSLLTFSLPAAAAASSDGQLPQISGLWEWGSGDSRLIFRIASQDAVPPLDPSETWKLAVLGRTLDPDVQSSSEADWFFIPGTGQPATTTVYTGTITDDTGNEVSVTFTFNFDSS